MEFTYTATITERIWKKCGRQSALRDERRARNTDDALFDIISPGMGALAMHYVVDVRMTIAVSTVWDSLR